MVPTAPDVTAPDITNILVSNLTSSSARITFNTSEVATGWVSYSLTGICPCTDVFSAGPGLSHTVNLTGLAQNTTYTFQVQRARRGEQPADLVGDDLAHARCSFLTTRRRPCRSRVRRPVPVVGAVNFNANATDNIGVDNVEFRIDGALIGTRTSRRHTASRGTRRPSKTARTR
jgi:hypothetical protein